MSSELEKKFKDQIVKFKKGDMIFEEADKSSDLYIILEGQILVYTRQDGNKIIPLSIVNSGSVFGEFSFFDGLPRSASAKAAADAKLIKIPRASKESDIKNLPPWMPSVLKTILERVRDVNDLMKRNKVVDERLKDKFMAMSDLNL